MKLHKNQEVRQLAGVKTPMTSLSVLRDLLEEHPEESVRNYESMFYGLKSLLYGLPVGVLISGNWYMYCGRVCDRLSYDVAFQFETEKGQYY